MPDLSTPIAQRFAEFLAPYLQRRAEEDQQREAHLRDVTAPPPPVPDAPAMFRPAPPDAHISGASASSPAPASPASGGITYSGSPDWASERGNFLARGSDPQIGAMADALQGRDKIDENLANRPDLMAEQRAKYAMQGLRQAAQMGDPAYRREQAAEDAVSSADTYMSPTVTAARGAQTASDVSHEEAMQRLGQRLGLTPEAQKAGEVAFGRQKQIHQIDAQGRSPLGALLAGQGGAGGSAGAGGGAGTVKMQAPDGSVREVQASQVDYYKSRGAQVVQ